MGRIGFNPDTASLDSIAALCHSNTLIPEGIFTHFSVSDQGQDGQDYTKRQYETFQYAVTHLASKGLTFPIRHCSNSAAVFDYPDYQMDMVRAGIVLYGLYPSEQVKHTLALRKVMELTSVISHIKEIESGDSVSYGRTFVAPRPMKIATVAIGYADGFWRSNSNMRYSLKINGHYAPVIGRVCMDQLMVDVTNIDCAIGDEVLIFGNDDICSAEKMAEANNTIEYEVMTKFSSIRATRKFVNSYLLEA